MRLLCIILWLMFAFRATAAALEADEGPKPAQRSQPAEPESQDPAPSPKDQAEPTADVKRGIDDAALNQDPEAARRSVLSAFGRHGAESAGDTRFFRIYGSVRVQAVQNGARADNDGQKEGFAFGDGGSRIGTKLHWNFTERSQLFGLMEAGFNIFDVFSSNASSEEGAQGRLLNPRLYYVGLDTPYLFATFGKNWSTYYKIAGMTDRFAVFGGNAAGVYNAGTDGGASGTGRASEVIQTRLYLDWFRHLNVKPFNLNVQYQSDQPIPQVDGIINYGDQYGASAWFDTEAGWGFGVAYNLSRIDDRKAPAIVAAGIDGDDEALALSTRWSGDKWYASAVWTRQKNHATNDLDLYVDGNGAELYAQWEFRPSWWLVGGGNWFKADEQDPQAGQYEINQTIIGLRRTLDSFNRMLYAEYLISSGASFSGEPGKNQLTLGIRWDFGYAEHRSFDTVEKLYEDTKKLFR